MLLACRPKLLKEHGLHGVSGGQDGSKSVRITAKCQKSQEIAANCEYGDQFRAAAFFPLISRSLPVHLILGGRADLVYDFICNVPDYVVLICCYVN